VDETADLCGRQRARSTRCRAAILGFSKLEPARKRLHSRRRRDLV